MTNESLPSSPPPGDLHQQILDQGMATAYQLYQDRRYAESEILCRGLLAASPNDWWCYSLYAAILRRTGRLRDAIAILERGLQHDPNQTKLQTMRDETMAAFAALTALAEKARKGETVDLANVATQEVV